MRAGRKPKPTHLKLLAGHLGHRPLNESEPEPEGIDEMAQPPAHLRGEARVEWARTLPILLRNHMITEVDLNSFAAYCQAYWTRNV
jgi:phage terminase small subunit